MLTRPPCAASVWRIVAQVMALAVSSPAATRLQRHMFIEPNAEYGGRYSFVRLRYDVYRRSGREFDYPAMERNLMTNDVSHPIFEAFFHTKTLDGMAHLDNANA